MFKKIKNNKMIKYIKKPNSTLILIYYKNVNIMPN